MDINLDAYDQYVPMLLLFLIVIFFIFWKISANKMKTLLQHQAMKRNGKINKFVILNPELEFDHQGDKVKLVNTISTGRHSRPHCIISLKLNLLSGIKITIYGKSLFGRLIKPVGLFGEPTKPLGMKNIQIGNPEFDQSFITESNDEMKLRSFLGNETQEVLLKLKERDPYLNVEKGKFSLHIYDAHPQSNEEYDFLIESSLALANKLKQLG